MLSMILVAVMLSATLLFPRADTIKSSAATTYHPSNQTLKYNCDIKKAGYGISGLSHCIEILDEVSYFEFYSGDQCIATNITFNDFPYFSSYCITKIIYKIVDDPIESAFNTADLTFNFDIHVENYSNISTNFDIFIEDFDAQSKLFTYTEEIPVSAYNGLVQSGPVFPAGYDFDEDSYSFGNFGDKSLSKKYFTSLFQSANTEEIYKAQKNTSGLCCGFAYTTASIYNGFPSATSIFNKSITGSQSYINSLRNAKKTSKITIGSNTISVSDYIKYSYVYQLSEDVFRQRNETAFTSSKLQGYEVLYDKNAIFELYDYVESLSNSNVLGISIWLNGLDIPGVEKPECHTVLCVGVEDNCILVDDSNLRNDHGFSDELGRLRINNNGTWVYEPYNGKYNSGNTFISYATDCYKPYSILLTGKKVQADDHWIENNDSGNSYIVDCEKIDTGKGILYCDAEEYQLNDIERTEFLDIGTGDSNTSQTATLYWVNSEDAISITNIQNSKNSSEFHLSSGDTIIETIVANNSSIMFNTDNSLNINSMENDKYSVSYSYCTVNDNYDIKVIEIALSGTASGDTITATQTETGLLVTGISDGTVTLSKDEEVIATKTVTDAISDIEITYDKTGADTSVELEYKQAECEHDDTDGDGKCDACGAPVATPPAPETPDTPADDDNSCTCICHSENSIVQFFYVIFRFLWQLFGMNMDCACGVKHFDFYIFA